MEDDQQMTSPSQGRSFLKARRSRKCSINHHNFFVPLRLRVNQNSILETANDATKSHTEKTNRPSLTDSGDEIQYQFNDTNATGATRFWRVVSE